MKYVSANFFDRRYCTLSQRVAKLASKVEVNALNNDRIHRT